MSRDYRLYLEDILEAIEKIDVYTVGVSFEQLGDNNMLVDAVLHNLEINWDILQNKLPELKLEVTRLLKGE
ncbi:MAG: hypothetical protein JXA78_19995 [Anaerolineales bacterium]|nr:hypothetical protein [Anaerolineales bacterium]